MPGFDIFAADETYVPLEWDASDLRTKVEALLARPKDAEKIAGNALRVHHTYFEKGGFVADVRRVLADL